MAKKRTDKTDIQKVEGVDPSYLLQYTDEDTSLDGMDQYMIIPRLKIIQSMTDQELKKRFGEGSVVIRPGDALVWQDGDEPFEFVPQFFFTEFCLWADHRDKESQAILARSYDPTSDIAKRSQTADTRFEVYEGHEGRPERDRWMKRYVQHFCFPGVIYGEHPLAGTPAVLSFERGEIGQGRSFISGIKLRRQEVQDADGNTRRVQVPLWAQVWQFRSGFRDRSQGKWYGFEFAPGRIIDPSDVAEFQTQHVELARLHEERRLVVDHAEGDDTDRPSDAVGEDAEY